MGLFSGTAEERFDALMIMLADHYGFRDAADCRDRLERASVLLDAPVPVIAVAHALPPHDPEVDELVRAFGEEAPLDTRYPAPRLTVGENSLMSLQLELFWPPSIAEDIARGAIPRPAVWYRLKGFPMWTRFCSARPLDSIPALLWTGNVGARGDTVEFGLAPYDTDPAARIVRLLEVVRP